MKDYDLIVVGSGCGISVAEEGLEHGLKTALVDRGPIGGTCLNVGCIPSKMLIYPADRIVDIQTARRLGIDAEVKGVDFAAIVKRMRTSIEQSRNSIRRGISENRELDFYEGTGHFVADYSLEVNGQRIKGKKFVLASGSRPLIPPFKGLDEVGYLTNETLLQLTERPESLIIAGGGYVAVEYAHFFAAMGTKVTILEMMDRLVLSEEPEVAELLKEELSRRLDVFTGVQVEKVIGGANAVTVMAKDKKTGQSRSFTASKILLAVGRQSNADLLKVENTGVDLDSRGYIKVNEYLETSKKNIYAIGDANGQRMFTHAANRQADIVGNNIAHGTRAKVDFSVTPHAIYSYPQIASVGMTEMEARKNHEILVGMALYSDIAKGEAMMEEKTFAKAILDKESGHILGFHIIGPFAPELIQEVVNAMASGGHVASIGAGMHIHPTASELILRTLANVHEE